jgi:hypothetical protein
MMAVLDEIIHTNHPGTIQKSKSTIADLFTSPISSIHNHVIMLKELEEFRYEGKTDPCCAR